MSEGGPGLRKTLSGLHLWGIAVGLVISGEYFGWSYGWALAGTLGFLVTTVFIAVMYTTFIFSFTELTTAIPHAGGPFAYSYRAFGPLGGYVAGFSTLVEFVFAPPAIALAIGAYLNAGQRSAVHESVRCTEHLAGVLTPLRSNLRTRHDWRVGDYKPFAMVGANHVGSMRNEPASFPDGNDPAQNPPTTTLLLYTIPSYTTYHAAVGMSKESWTVQLNGSNLGNSDASTFTSSGQFIKSEVPLRPRVLTLQFRYRF